MSTRSLIGLTLPNGKVRFIYCHNDGDFEEQGVGPMLFEHYQCPEKIGQLINLGDISSLDQRVAPGSGESHSLGSKATGVTVAYRRDRGEVIQTREMSFTGFRRSPPDMGQEYMYHFHRGGWWAKKARDSRWEKLEKQVKKKAASAA